MTNNGVNVAKDGIPYLLTGTGAGMSQAPYPVIQVIGCVVGVIGLVIGAMRVKVAMRQADETTRANDLKQEQWEHKRKYESKNGEEAESKKAEQSYDSEEGS